MSSVATLPDQTTIGRVALTTSNAGELRSFYERVVGIDDEIGLLELHEDSNAPPPSPRATGLYHTAFLLPTRRDLALALVRVARAGWRLTGASDHLVSEAVYLDDPEGNGIEIYRDRPREEWERVGDGWRIDTLPLDLDDVLRELDGEEPEPGPAPRGTRVGHVHLKVSDIAAAEAFYVGALGFEVMAKLPSAGFVSAGGYHHHLGFNVWESRGGPAPAPGSRGLRWYEVVLPSPGDVAVVRERLEASGSRVEEAGQGILTEDPAGNRLVLRVA